ncbi:MAG TPA: tripartite tricarboxylate transporter substrate binding protein [Reyranella sp.]|nr:tripartite tricarboxylate transporter substrate binding protein [Reyranella sp.]
MMKKLVAAMAVLVGLSTTALAQQDYPNRIVKIMQGFPPGGNVDIIARILGHEMEKSLGQSIVVEAKPGLAGALAAETIARTDPDGYTLLVLPSAHPAYAALSKNVKFKVVDDFTWISVASFYPFMIAVKADSRFQTLKQLIDEARTKPGDLKYGSAGVGSILHTTVELIGNQTKTKFLHIPYRGEAPALTGLLQGEIDFIAATTGPVSPRVKSGEFRALAVTGKTRWRDFPNVPTVDESAIPGFEVISWTGLAGPPNLPKPIVDRLNAELRKALAVPEVKSKLEAMGGDPRATTPDEMKALVQRQYDTWKKLAVEANLSIN